MLLPSLHVSEAVASSDSRCRVPFFGDKGCGPRRMSWDGERLGGGGGGSGSSTFVGDNEVVMVLGLVKKLVGPERQSLQLRLKLLLLLFVAEVPPSALNPPRLSPLPLSPVRSLTRKPLLRLLLLLLDVEVPPASLLPAQLLPLLLAVLRLSVSPP